jgi:hypothetical protein
LIGNSEKSSEALKIQNDQFEKKEKISGFDQPFFRANLTADRMWLADLLCCALYDMERRLVSIAKQLFLLLIFTNLFVIDHADFTVVVVRYLCHA